MRFNQITAAAFAIAFAAGAPAFAQTAATPSAVVVVAPEGYTIAEFASVTPEQMKGATIYDSEGNTAGTITDLIVGPDNAVTGVVSDVSGFVGMDKHHVALKPEHIHVYRNTTGELRAYVMVSKEELAGMPMHTER